MPKRIEASKRDFAWESKGGGQLDESNGVKKLNWTDPTNLQRSIILPPSHLFRLLV